ncbi:hypothetical protein TNCV_2941691 [Trichonephila clavipes]|nr:hypothetical protein TNCV_2941691 [Trichonephila clavipes]
MTSYTNQEMADIHFIYGVADENALETRGLYGERFPSRRLPNRKTFECLHRRLRKPVRLLGGCKTQGVPRVRGHRNLKSMRCVNSRSNRRRAHGLYQLPQMCLDGETYLVFLQEVLPVLLQNVPVNIKARMWFQHDGAPAHFSADVRKCIGYSISREID